MRHDRRRCVLLARWPRYRTPSVAEARRSSLKRLRRPISITALGEVRLASRDRAAADRRRVQREDGCPGSGRGCQCSVASAHGNGRTGFRPRLDAYDRLFGRRRHGLGKSESHWLHGDYSRRAQAGGPQRTGDVIDKALEAGANDVSSIRFDVKDRRAARDQAIKTAFETARRDAEVLAQASGSSLGRLVQLSIGGHQLGAVAETPSRSPRRRRARGPPLRRPRSWLQ